eukprot:Colp12_sorted_trinity150504_noHs@2044
MESNVSCTEFTTLNSDITVAQMASVVNKLSHLALKGVAQSQGLNSVGDKTTLKKRIKNHFKEEIQIKQKEKELRSQNEPEEFASEDESKGEELPDRIKVQRFDYFLVMDFEATCQENNSTFLHEIIEFPVIMVNTRTLEIEDTFHYYCRPVRNPKLSEFCKSLTGISQETTDAALPFPEVMKFFKKWIDDKCVSRKKSFAFITDGPWDIGNFLRIQCEISQIEVPEYCKNWVDMRYAYAGFYGQRGNISRMLEWLNMKFEGHEHSGIDDTKNITRIVIKMVQDGYIFSINSNLNRWISRQKDKRRKARQGHDKDSKDKTT